MFKYRNIINVCTSDGIIQHVKHIVLKNIHRRFWTPSLFKIQHLKKIGVYSCSRYSRRQTIQTIKLRCAGARRDETYTICTASQSISSEWPWAFPPPPKKPSSRPAATPQKRSSSLSVSRSLAHTLSMGTATRIEHFEHVHNNRKLSKQFGGKFPARSRSSLQ